MKKTVFFLFAIILVSFSSCVSREKVVYLQGNQSSGGALANYEPLIQNDDLLYINVSSMEPSAVAPFNLDSTTSSSNSFSVQKQTYLVDSYGNIEFPVIGTIKVAGYSITSFKDLLKEKLKIFIIDPIVNIRILNFKVTITGEVTKPGVISINSQRLTLFEALAMAGDLTIFGKRDNILIVRDIQGVKTYNRVDITKADFVNSPFYYLDQNDLVYIEPKKTKIDSSALGSNTSAILSIIGFAITTTLILTR